MYLISAHLPPIQISPCTPSPCGPYSICKEDNEKPSCSCLPSYIGHPPNCQPECTSNNECPTDKACTNNQCRDPCVGTCGVNSNCKVISHTPMCYCQKGYIGDAFYDCHLEQILNLETTSPCESSPCGFNAECREKNNIGSCACLPGYIGNPYEGCRPECSVNSDCSPNRACIHNKCQDPCPGTCATYATCNVVNHMPICACLQSYTGDPYVDCKVAGGYFRKN